jgi:hypothetical protein
VDQPSKDVDAFDAPAGLDPPIDRAGNGHLKVDASMRSGGVVMRQVGSQDMLQVPAVADQQPVQALAANCPHPPLGIGIPARAASRNLHDVDAASASTASKTALN